MASKSEPSPKKKATKAAKTADPVVEAAPQAAAVPPAAAAPVAKSGTKKAAAKAEPVAAPAAARAVAAEPTHDQIARRAYEIWLSRGGGSAENWFEAEAQLRRG